MAGRAWRSAAFVLFLLVSVGLGLEAGVRLVIPQALILDPPDLWEPSSEIGWRRRPNSRVWVDTAGREVEICTDARGDRIDCDAREERGCETRILVIGDSFVAALAVPFRETVWSRLERDTGACADVAGVGGYGMSQYVEIVVSKSSLENRFSTSPSQSLHARRRSRIHAARPTGESLSAYARVCGSVLCTAMWLTV